MLSIVICLGFPRARATFVFPIVNVQLLLHLAEFFFDVDFLEFQRFLGGQHVRFLVAFLHPDFCKFSQSERTDNHEQYHWDTGAEPTVRYDPRPLHLPRRNHAFVVGGALRCYSNTNSAPAPVSILPHLVLQLALSTGWLVPLNIM